MHGISVLCPRRPTRKPRIGFQLRIQKHDIAKPLEFPFVLDRQKLARYGLSVDDANTMVMTAVGGDNQTTTIEGRQRYGVNVRYARDFRDDVDALRWPMGPSGIRLEAWILPKCKQRTQPTALS
jgi:hypothetical protein